MSEILGALEASERHKIAGAARGLLGSLIQPDQYVGELYSIGYESAVVQIHDYQRRRVGGIPSMCFLIATRLRPDEEFDYTKEDSCLILLRVLDAAPLPNQQEAERIRAEAAQRATGEGTHWDEPGLMDGYTANVLSFAGVRCRVLGTFYLDPPLANSVVPTLRFGSDISNYYPNKGLKVYKPNAAALGAIVNYRDPGRPQDHPLANREVPLGEVRYASTNRGFQGVSDVRVSVVPTDLLAQKTALFGMTRTGKSNSVKIVAKSVFELRFQESAPTRVGQLIIDPNGEYANENTQDAAGSNPNALKNVWMSAPTGQQGDVVTYGVTPHPNDPARRLMKINFFRDQDLQTGKEIINDILREQAGGIRYLGNFVDVRFLEPEPNDHGSIVRCARHRLVYRALLAAAGFELPPQMPTASTRVRGTPIFGQDLLAAMRGCLDPDMASDMQWAASIFDMPSPPWSSLAQALENLRLFIAKEAKTGFQAFNTNYRNTRNGDNWHDQPLVKLLGMFEYPNGVRMIGRASEYHSGSVSSDFADDIVANLVDGRLVIIDQAVGDPELKKQAAERVMWRVFNRNLQAFTTGQSPPEIVIYVEEAHNYLPAGSDQDMTSVWVRTAKEGGKLRIGLVYSTQEVSGVHRSILKNTANWFIGHLNNSDELVELRKYYDFADFERSILRAQDKGFLRVKTQSNMFVVPVQVDRFVLPNHPAPT